MKKGQRGASLVEIMFVLALLGMLVGVLARFFGDARLGLISSENDSDLSAMSGIASQNLAASVKQSERLLADLSLQSGSDPFGAYRAAVLQGISQSASQAPLPVTWTVSPKIYTYSTVVHESSTGGVAYMGNSLLFIAALPPVVLKGVTNMPLVPTPAPAGAGTATPTPAPTYTPTPLSLTPLSDISLDRYQFVYLYLALDASRKIGSTGLPGRLRLVEWRSRPYVSYSQLSSSAGVSSNLLLYMSQRLQALGYDSAYDLGDNGAGTAFHSLNPASVPILNPAGAAQNPMPEQSWGYVEEYRALQEADPDPLRPKGRLSRLSFGGNIFGSGFYSIAYNTTGSASAQNRITALTGTQQGGFTVPRFTLPSAASPYPAGFEVGIAGTRPGAREVLIRAVYMAVSAAKPPNSKEFLAAEAQANATLQNPD
jgi:hypothetical protein